MPWMINYDETDGKIKSFYHTDKHKNIPEPTIELSDAEYLTAALNQKDYAVNPDTKTLKRVEPA